MRVKGGQEPRTRGERERNPPIIVEHIIKSPISFTERVFCEVIAVEFHAVEAGNGRQLLGYRARKTVVLYPEYPEVGQTR